MYNLKLGMSINEQFGISFEDQLRLLKQTGFESFFHYLKAPNGEVATLKTLADELGLDFHSLHAPGSRADSLWEEGDTTDAHMLELKLCLQDCIDNHIPVMVMHATASFDYPAPTGIGLRNFETLLRMVEGTDTKIAIEDLHLLPFDGIIDWNSVAQALATSPYNGPLPFEVKIQNQRGRHEHDGYLAMSIEQYFAECYKHACRVGAMYLRAKKNK